VNPSKKPSKKVNHVEELANRKRMPTCVKMLRVSKCHRTPSKSDGQKLYPALLAASWWCLYCRRQPCIIDSLFRSLSSLTIFGRRLLLRAGHVVLVGHYCWLLFFVCPKHTQSSLVSLDRESVRKAQKNLKSESVFHKA